VKRNIRVFFSSALIAIALLAIGTGLIQYDQTYGFDATFNPAILVLWIMALFGVAGIIGLILTRFDIKKGYCDLGITEEQIRRYREKHSIADPYQAMQGKKHEADDDTKRQ